MRKVALIFALALSVHSLIFLFWGDRLKKWTRRLEVENSLLRVCIIYTYIWKSGFSPITRDERKNNFPAWPHRHSDRDHVRRSSILKWCNFSEVQCHKDLRGAWPRLRVTGMVNWLFAVFSSFSIYFFCLRLSDANDIRYISYRFNWGIPMSTISARYNNAKWGGVEILSGGYAKGQQEDLK